MVPLLLLVPTVNVAYDGARRTADQRAGSGITAGQATDGCAAQCADGRAAHGTLLGGRHVGAAHAECERRNRE
ncbi:hypothetical protein BN874_830070 [Candidatus Contendobacter odensis Run_B_J11]|uniref:Uncharacterized protein n=1 Tax=Candidatus Contendobacter odensis Run_B_J11 TaxID=1400861 RepID=A0A7U7J677_9GAMM|nr:hypothetical protein BN874_830070 [Candidatus Contendobacter odensis Run_B_J11]